MMIDTYDDSDDDDDHNSVDDTDNNKDNTVAVSIFQQLIDVD